MKTYETTVSICLFFLRLNFDLLDFVPDTDVLDVDLDGSLNEDCKGEYMLIKISL